MMVERRAAQPPQFSICIPQFNRTSFLIQACQSIEAQQNSTVEVCISDDRSTDGREPELLHYLESSGLSYVYQRQSENQRYDGNLRNAIALARGEWCLLLGNDDALARSDTLQNIASGLAPYPAAHVALTNYEQYDSGAVYVRVRETRLGAGPAAAVKLFRNFSFVSGVLIRRESAQRHATTRWDGGEMYQMFLSCRTIAAGHECIGLPLVAIRKDIAIPGEEVDSYARRAVLNPCPIIARPINVVGIAPLVAAAIAPHASHAQQLRLNQSTARQLFLFTYPFWLFEYRRIQSWRYAAGIALAMRPDRSLAAVPLSRLGQAVTTLLYAAVTVAGLLLPIGLFDRTRGWLYRLAKRST